ncbi:MAG TPA: sigma-54-dependent Fis family transcriptional regulator [Desulfobacterales bacterium]|nr:sigma-54-dependent Fis family transcriptional regulator [Desulfobacterales bacterium]
MLQGLRRMVGREFSDLRISVESSARQALRIIGAEAVNLVLLDIKMPEMSGLKLLREMLNLDPGLTVVMITGYGTVDMAVEAMKGGAFDFLTKPFVKEGLFRVIHNGLAHNDLIRENYQLRQQVAEGEPLSEFVGDSVPMRRLYNAIRTAAESDFTVLVRGESGTGKELVMLAIHRLSKRGTKPLVMVNCPAIPDHLLESELFGHQRGAFTGAEKDQPGLFAQADKSTLCLDEIGDISTAVQAKLLRVLQEHEIRPLGASLSRALDVRIIAATNQNLEKRIKAGEFRNDLFYRLNVVMIRTPSLNEIREDIPLLADYFTHNVCRELGIPVKRMAVETVERLMVMPWPGNVRELQNMIRTAVLFCPDDIIRPQHLTAETTAYTHETTADSSGLLPYKVAKERNALNFTTSYVHRLLRETGGNVSGAARKSGLTRAALQKIIRRYNLDPADYRSAALKLPHQ